MAILNLRVPTFGRKKKVYGNSIGPMESCAVRAIICEATKPVIGRTTISLASLSLLGITDADVTAVLDSTGSIILKYG